MSQQVATEHQPDLSGLTGSPGQKRKRGPDSPIMDRSKRPAAPPVSMGPSSAETAAFIENAIEASHAAAANGVNVADFNALQQATQDNNEHADSTNAASAAQAALGMYPTLHVPPSTEEQFAAQAAAEVEQHNEPQYQPPSEVVHEPAPEPLMGDQGVPQGHEQPPPNGMQPQTPRYSNPAATSNPKPTVGSEEWHKMRKDNHKEGTYLWSLPTLHVEFD